MTTTTGDYSAAPGLVDAARDIIRREGDGCVVGISALLDKLSETFGDRYRVTPAMQQLLDLIGTLWADPHIDQIPGTEWIEFAWNEGGSMTARPPETA